MEQSLLNEEELRSKLISFIANNIPHYAGREDQVREIFDLHEKYKTHDFLLDNKGLLYYMRYDVSPSWTICEVLDLWVRKDKRNKNFIKFIIARNWSRYPMLRYFSFIREYKYKNRKPRLYSILKFFKGVTSSGR